MTRMVKGILIDPFACSVSEIEYDADDFTQLYPILSHESMEVDTFTIARSNILKPGDVVFIDDEGLLKNCTRFFKLAGFAQPLAGKGIVLGSDNEGETISAKSSLDIVRMSVMFAELQGGRLLATQTPWVAKENVK